MNSGRPTTILLALIDLFSKLAWCTPLKNKSASSLMKAFKDLLAAIVHTTLQTDCSVE